MLYDFNQFPGAGMVTTSIATTVVGSDLSSIGRSKGCLEIDLFFFLSSMTAIGKFDANDAVVLAPLVPISGILSLWPHPSWISSSSSVFLP